MLRKLRRKFVIINMSFSMLMLFIIFGTIYISTSERLQSQSVQMANQGIMEPGKQAPPDIKGENMRLPGFTIHIDENGNVETEGYSSFDLSDEESLNQVIEKVIQSESDIGVLEDFNLRYVRTGTPDGTRITFSDVTYERAVLRTLARNFIFIGVIAFFILYIVSTLLAKWAIEPVEKAWQQQKQFVADASHELKTPLTVIMTDTDLMNAEDCSEKDRKTLLESVRTMTKQMSGLVESLLDLARIDAGKVKEIPCNVSFSDMASEAAMTFEPVLFEKGYTFTYDIEPNIVINAVGGHLKQLCTIFLDNASKYASPQAEIIMTLKRTGKKALLTVSNQGEEISKEEMTHLFERFFRADKVRTMSNSYGLGLSIAEGIAQEHKGKIWAESKDGWNSFHVELPIKLNNKALAENIGKK